MAINGTGISETGQKYLKPITVARQEFIDGMVKLVEGSNLPYFVIEDILKRMYDDAKSLAKQQYNSDVKAWKEMQQKLEQEKVQK